MTGADILMTLSFISWNIQGDICMNRWSAVFVQRTVMMLTAIALLSGCASGTGSKLNQESSVVLSFDEIAEQAARMQGRSKAENRQECREAGISETTDCIRLMIPVPSMEEYSPRGIHVYCQGSDQNDSMACDHIVTAALDRQDADGGASREFAGNVYLNLIDVQTIDWSVNGDFYSHGTTTAFPGDSLDPEKSTSIALEVSSSSGYIGYYNESGRYYLGNEE